MTQAGNKSCECIDRIFAILADLYCKETPSCWLDKFMSDNEKKAAIKRH